MPSISLKTYKVYAYGNAISVEAVTKEEARRKAARRLKAMMNIPNSVAEIMRDSAVEKI